MNSWGPVGALAVMLALIELAKYIAQRRNGNSSSGCGFNSGDRAHLDGICNVVKDIKHTQVSYRELGWGKGMEDMVDELRSIREILVRDRVQQDNFFKQMEKHFATMECMAPLIQNLQRSHESD